MLFDRLANRRLQDVVESSRAQLERCRRLLLPSPGRPPNTYKEHRKIFEALKRRDPDAAAAAMGEHLDAVMTELKDFAAAHPDLFEP
jgi:DNA-binding GntR family transcriptional regulator